jgi:hypothetical protein
VEEKYKEILNIKEFLNIFYRDVVARKVRPASISTSPRYLQRGQRGGGGQYQGSIAERCFAPGDLKCISQPPVVLGVEQQAKRDPGAVRRMLRAGHYSFSAHNWPYEGAKSS